MIVSKNVMLGLLTLAAGAGLAAILMPSARSRRGSHSLDAQSERVDEASEDSFPASDPPSHSATAAATPDGIS